MARGKPKPTVSRTRRLAREAEAILGGGTRHWIMHPDGTAQLAGDLQSWERWMETGDRRVGDDTVDGLRVSTVFLGLDHNMAGHGPPVLWETMIFHKGGYALGWQRRYTTRLAALRGHGAVVGRLRKGWRP